jgi:hypothetical protein
MPFVYNNTLATTESITTANNMYTTSATPGNLVDHMRFLTVASRAYIGAVYLQGKGAGLTAISGISARIVRLGTASTVGTAASQRPRDASAPAADCTSFTGPTIGSGAISLQVAIGCGAAGPGGWVAQNPDAQIALTKAGGANGNADFISGSGTASLGFDATIEHME